MAARVVANFWAEDPRPKTVLRAFHRGRSFTIATMGGRLVHNRGDMCNVEDSARRPTSDGRAPASSPLQRRTPKVGNDSVPFVGKHEIYLGNSSGLCPVMRERESDVQRYKVVCTVI